MNQVTPIPQGSQNVIPLTKGDVFRRLNQKIPLNNFHLPDHIYRADLIDEQVLDLPPGDRALILDSAALPLGFEHGYPAILESQPFWEQLPSEPTDAYDAYMRFLELPEITRSENPIRLLPMIATLVSRPIKEITDWCHMFYWHWRARAYDLYLVACHRKKREQQVMTIEGYHFKEAGRLLEGVIKIADAKIAQEVKELQDDPTAQTETKLKDLISMAKDLVAVQRISVGLPGAGPSSIDIKVTEPRHATAQEIYKSLAKSGAGDEQPKQRSAEMDTLLESPDDLASIQEIMIRYHNPDHKLPDWGSKAVINDQQNKQTANTQASGGGARRIERAAPRDSNPHTSSRSSIVEDLGNPNG